MYLTRVRVCVFSTRIYIHLEVYLFKEILKALWIVFVYVHECVFFTRLWVRVCFVYAWHHVCVHTFFCFMCVFVFRRVYYMLNVSFVRRMLFCMCTRFFCCCWQWHHTIPLYNERVLRDACDARGERVERVRCFWGGLDARCSVVTWQNHCQAYIILYIFPAAAPTNACLNT